METGLSGPPEKREQQQSDLQTKRIMLSSSVVNREKEVQLGSDCEAQWQTEMRNWSFPWLQLNEKYQMMVSSK